MWLYNLTLKWRREEDCMDNTFDPHILALIHQALDEDIGSGDVTSNSIIPADAQMHGQFIAKQSGIIAGLDVAQAVYALFDPRVQFESLVEEGTPVIDREVVARASGSARSLLTVERTALNFLGRIVGHCNPHPPICRRSGRDEGSYTGYTEDRPGFTPA